MQCVVLKLADRSLLTGSTIGSKGKDIQIPKVQKRALAKSFAEYEGMSQSRDESIVRSYASGGCSCQQVGDYFKLHFTQIGKIVRKAREV